MHEIFTFRLYFFKRMNEKNISHLKPIFYEGLLSFLMHVCMLQAHVQYIVQQILNRTSSLNFLLIHFLPCKSVC
jgi:hypothetical protein